MALYPEKPVYIATFIVFVHCLAIYIPNSITVQQKHKQFPLYQESRISKFSPQFPSQIKTSDTMIISSRKLIKMARKWQRVAVLGGKRISFLRNTNEVLATDGCSVVLAQKGHFIVYTTDKRRFSFPISYLNSLIFRELFRMSEEEFGLPNDGPIMLPCDSEFMAYVTSLMQMKAGKDVEKALLMSIAAASRCSSSSSYYLPQQESVQQMLLCGC